MQLPIAIVITADISIDFLLLAQHSAVTQINMPSINQTTMQMYNLTFVTSIDYDVEHNCVFWADYTRIVRQCLNNDDNRTQVLLASGANRIESIAYDWLSEILYYHDSGQRLIAAIDVSAEAWQKRQQLNHSHAWRHTVIDYFPPFQITSFALHPRQGLLYWAQMHDYNHNDSNASLHRIELDGTGEMILLKQPSLEVPMDIAIDEVADRLYWIDLGRWAILSCDLEGESIRVERNLTTTNGTLPTEYPKLTVSNGIVYWPTSQTTIHVWNANSSTDSEIKLIADDPVRPIHDIKIFSGQRNSATNACSSGTHNCSHFCVSKRNAQHACVCPDQLHLHAGVQCLCVLGDEETCHENFGNAYCSDRHRCGNEAVTACVANNYVCGESFIYILYIGVI